jgi:hypothetical protein
MHESGDPNGKALFGGEEWNAKEITEGDIPHLQKAIELCADYYELTTGSPPGPGEAHGLFIALPESATYDAKKVFGIVDLKGNLIGVLDGINDLPTRGTWRIGLLMLLPAWRPRKFSSQIVQAFK